VIDRDQGRSLQKPWAEPLRHVGDSLFDNTKAAFSIIGLGGLLTVLVAGEIFSPGFTRFWGYLTGQVVFVLLIVLLGEVVFPRQGGFSWVTHLVAIAACWADVLGNAAGFYRLFAEYDKITHFFGIAAVTSGAYDILRALAVQGRLRLPPTARLWLSVALGVAVGLGWEVYEFLADVVFRTVRVYGAWDTFHDIVFDALGALSAGILLWVFERQAAELAAGALDGQEVVALVTARPEEPLP